MLVLAAASPVQAEALRLRALLVAPAAERDTPPVDPGLRGEARVIVHDDGQARLDLVSWALPDGPVDAALRFDDPAESTAPLLVVPLHRDADEGRVIGAGFQLDADAARRLRAGEGRVLLTSGHRPDMTVPGALHPHPHPRPSQTPVQRPLQAAD